MRAALKSLIATGLLAAPVLLAPTSARAAFDNYNSVLLGSRAAGLGHAFTALGGDVAASPFTNPATTVLTPGNALAATATLYTKNETRLGKTEDLFETTQRVNRGFFRSVPSSSGSVTHFGSFSLALSLLVPDYEQYAGPVKTTDGVNSFVNQTDESFWAGASLAARLTETHSLGLTVYYTARSLTRSVNDTATPEGTSNTTTVLEEKSLTNNSIVAIFGYHHRLAKHWSAGLSFRPPSLPFSGSASYYRSVSEPGQAPQIFRDDGLRTQTKVPSKLALGIAREVPGVSTLSFDMHLYEATSYNDVMGPAESVDQIVHRQVVNFSFGYEAPVSPTFKWRMGVFTNFSSHPVPDPARGVRQADGVEMSGFSGNMEFQTAANTWVTFGGSYSGGRGTTLQSVAGRLTPIAKTQHLYTLLIATGFQF